jgi:hypothetical protein
LLFKNIYPTAAVAHRAEGKFLLDKENSNILSDDENT